MDTLNLRAFLAVADCESFSMAADQLYLTQSAISKRIAQLEQQMGKKLFDRIARQVSLTEAGAELLPRARHILQEFEAAIQAINDLSGKASGRLRLAISHHLGLHRLPPVLKQYSQQQPDVTLDIEFMDSEKAYEQVLHAESELAVITLAPDSHPNIYSQKIWSDPLRFICAKDHSLAELQQPSLQDLANYPIILPGLNTYTGRIIQTLFKHHDIPLQAVMCTNYLETIGTMVEVGLGWSVLPETLLQHLHVMPIKEPCLERELGYIHHTKRSLSNAAVAFLTLMDTIGTTEKPERSPLSPTNANNPFSAT